MHSNPHTNPDFIKTDNSSKTIFYFVCKNIQKLCTNESTFIHVLFIVDSWGINKGGNLEVFIIKIL